MKTLFIALLFLPFFASGQITICDQDTVPIVDFVLPTLRPVILCPFDTGFVFWWDMTLPGGGGDAAYFHSMTFFTDGAYHLGVDDSHILTPAKPWCFICVEGTNYNAVTAAWGVADSSGGFTPVVNCGLVPEHSYTYGWPDKFAFDAPAHIATGGGFTVVLSNSPTYGAPYIYKTPGYLPTQPNPFPIYNTSTSAAPWVPYTRLRVRYTFPNGTQCTEDSEMPGLRTGPMGFDGEPKERRGWYIEDRKLRFGQ